jgi:hypothetical protein
LLCAFPVCQLGWSVSELEERIESHELTEWQIYEAIEPFGEQRADLRAGIIASTIANVNRGKGQKAFTATDFMPYLEKEQEQSAEDATVAALMELQGKFSALKGIGK